MKVMLLQLPPSADLLRALEAWMGEQAELADCLISAVPVPCLWLSASVKELVGDWTSAGELRVSYVVTFEFETWMNTAPGSSSAPWEQCVPRITDVSRASRLKSPAGRSSMACSRQPTRMAGCQRSTDIANSRNARTDSGCFPAARWLTARPSCSCR